MGIECIVTPLLWMGCTLFVLAMLALDLGVVHRQAHELRIREALLWTGVWIALALVFNVGVYIWFGSERAFEFLTGYLIEKALSIDNIFVFLVVFSVFAVRPRCSTACLSGASSARSSCAPSSSCLARRCSSNSTGLATWLGRSCGSRASTCSYSEAARPTLSGTHSCGCSGAVSQRCMTTAGDILSWLRAASGTPPRCS